MILLYVMCGITIIYFVYIIYNYIFQKSKPLDVDEKTYIKHVAEKKIEEAPTSETLLKNLQNFKARLKDDFNLTSYISAKYMSKTLLEDTSNLIYFQLKINESYYTHHIDIRNIENTTMNKKLNVFAADDVYKSICLAILEKDKNIIDSIKKYFDDIFTNSVDNITNFIIEEFSASIKNLNQSGLSSENFKSILNENDAKNYDRLIQLFLDNYIYSTFVATNNPIMKYNQMKFSTYFYQVKFVNNIEYFEKYMKIIDIIHAKITENDPKYTEPIELQKILFNSSNIFSHIENTYIIPNIIKIIENNTGQCFLHNQGNVDVNMRPCILYFISDKEFCDKNSVLYRYSILQLENILAINTNIIKSYIITGKTTLMINLYDDIYMNVILSGNNILKIKNILRRHFENQLGTLNPSHYSEVSLMIDDIIKNVNTLKVIYGGIEYLCLDIYKILNMKKNNPNSLQMCKISLENLYEVKDVIGQEKRENKILGNTYINHPKIWGSCFYNVPNDKTNIADQNTIKMSIKEKYNIDPTCQTDTILENIKCKSGCKLTNNKFIGFSPDDFSLNIMKTAMVDSMDILSSYSFLKIKFVKLKTAASITYKYSFSFVKFNNTSKEFEIISDIQLLNTKLKNTLYTIENLNGNFIFRPNIRKKNIYVCSFYENKLISYSTLSIDDFSLRDFDIQIINLIDVNQDFKTINEEMSVFQRRCVISENMRDSLSCINTHIEYINSFNKLFILSRLTFLESQKKDYEDIIDENNRLISEHEDLLEQCSSIQRSSTITCNIENSKEIKNNAQQQIMIYDRYLKEVNTEISRVQDILIEINKKKLPYYISPFQTYFLDNYNVYTENLQKTNVSISSTSVNKYINKLYDDQFLLSNDDCIYVRLDD